MNKTLLLLSSTALLAGMALTGCMSDSDDSGKENLGDKKFLVISADNDNNGTAYQITSSLAGGEISAVKSVETGFDYSYRAKFFDGFLYDVDVTVGKLGKFSVSGNLLTEVAGLPLSTGGSNVYRISAEKLILLKDGYFKDGKVPYRLLNAGDLTETKSGNLEIPILPGYSIWPNGVIAKEGKLLVTYIHCDTVDYANNDTAHVSVFDATTLAYEKTIRDPRTASTGYSIDFDHVVEAGGDVYISTSNSDYWGINEKLPAAILRIKAGSTDFDPDYFFDVSAKIGGNHYVSLMSVGNGKAIIKAFRKELITKYSDFSSSFTIDHYVVDLAAKSATKLDIPLIKGVASHYAALGNGKFAIPANTQDGNFFYVYDAATGTATKGAKLVGADQIYSLVALQ